MPTISYPSEALYCRGSHRPTCRLTHQYYDWEGPDTDGAFVLHMIKGTSKITKAKLTLING